MGDPFVIATIALGLSVVASAVRMADWFLHADPKVAAELMRWGARGVAAASVPLLAVLLFKEQWTAATALAAAMVLAPAVLGRRLWRWVGVPSPAGHVVSARANSADASERSFADEAELVRYSAAVLEAYLRRTTPAAGSRGLPAIADHSREDLGADRNGELNGKGEVNRNGTGNGNAVGNSVGMVKANGAGNSGNGHAESFGLGAMSEDEARAVLAVEPGATEAEIRAAHGRISAIVDPAGGGSPYLAIKVDQAKEVLVRAGAPATARAKPPRKRSATRRRPLPPA